VADVTTVTACADAVNALSASDSATQLQFPPDDLIGAGAVETAIADAIVRAGGSAVVGVPLGPPQDIPWVDFGNLPPKAHAQYQNYTNGTLFWSPGLDAHFVSGKIAQKYQIVIAQGSVDKTVGFPASDVVTSGSGKVLRLQNGRDVQGSIY